MAYGAVTYDLPLTASGLRLYALASHTETEPGDTLATLGTEGSATTLEAELSYPVIRSRDLNLVVSGGFASRDSRSEDDFVKPTYDDHIRSVDLGVQANALDTLGGYSTFAASYTKGLDIFGATTSSDPNKSRVNGDGQFERLNFEISRLQPLVQNVSVLLAATGQTSFGESLLSSEQFGLGGSAYGRGYDPSELTGDRGLAGKAELRWDAFRSDGFLSSMQIYSFYEGGAVWLEAPLPGEQERSSLASAGLGTRVVAWNSTNISLEVSQPLTRDVAAENNRDARVYFSIGQSF
jgi:hemolysin activation/secretion protein